MREELRTQIQKTGLKEVAWFIALWVMGVAVIISVGGVIKLFLST